MRNRVFTDEYDCHKIHLVIPRRDLTRKKDCCDFCGATNKKLVAFDNSAEEYGPLLICGDCLRKVISEYGV